MKLLVATYLTQGNDAGDYCWTVEGELVTPIGDICSNRSCGCARGFPGLASAKSTTTAIVVDLPHIGLDELSNVVVDSLNRGGWFDHIDGSKQSKLVQTHVQAIMRATTHHPVDTVVCRDHDWVFARESQAA